MCGIVGYFDFERPGPALGEAAFDRMIDSLAHRGPDGRGRYQAAGAGMGHRRLAILDTLERSAQPMASPRGDVHITFNGEIYNFRELRAELEKLGHAFTTTGDTEVLLHAYLQWDVDCLDRLSGIFAFGILDAGKKRLWLARDPIGVKPLFYSEWNGRLLFASEVGAILACPGFDASPDPLGVDAFFTFSYVPAPMTGYRHIRQLRPAEHLLAEGGKITLKKYWDLPLGAEKHAGTEAELQEEFNRLLARAVKRQMVSDVPLGAFLSSGVDSFAIVAAMQQAGLGRTTAFSVGFTDPRFDELPYTRQAAQALGVNLVSETLAADWDKLCQPVAPHCRDPLADSSCLPVYLVCQMARRHVKVALSGDGGDELLAGYATYRAPSAARKYRRLPAILRRGVLAPLARHLPEIGGKYSLRERAARFVLGAEEGPFRDQAAWRIVTPERLKNRIYTDDFRRQIGDFDPLELYAEPMRRARSAGCGELDSLLYADLAFYLPNDMLAKVDRMSMAHGLEVRVPLLDVELVEFCWRLPESMKMRGRRTKHVLRQAIASRYPPALARRPKSGFNVDLGLGDESPVRLDNPFCRRMELGYGDFFGRYHRMMFRYLLRMLPERS